MAQKLKKFILFSLSGETYAMPLLAESRFMSCDKVSPVPDVHSAVLGISYHQGQIITILDTAKILKLHNKNSDNSCLLFFFDGDYYGLLIDEGGETIKAKRIFTDKKNKNFNKYIKANKKKIYILEPEDLLRSVEIYDKR